MAWYKAGTISATQGQTSITGLNTKFATNARVGDGLRAPDGEWYEITNIASETTLGIYPAYQGVSFSDSSNYTIAPLQGYNKETADRLRAITDTLTVVTSVAGKTGDVVVTKTDVGLSNVDNTSDVNKPISAAQATINATIPSVQSSTTDRTAGVVLKQGAFGLGEPIVLNSVDVNTVYQGGFYYISSGTNKPAGEAQGWLEVNPINAVSYFAQHFRGITGNEYTRNAIDGILSPWVIVATGGANSSITSLTGLTTALSITQGGTGGNSQSTARAGLGLGTAATANVGVAAGNVMAVGAGGWLGVSTIDGNANAAKSTGFYSLSGSASVPYSAMQLLHSDWGNDPRWQSQLALGISQNRAYFRSILKDQTSATPWAEFYTTSNTTLGSGGALSAASPIVRIADLENTTRNDLQEQTFEPAGWGVSNDEARGAVVERLDTGVYHVKGSLGLASEGWRTHDPCSPDGGRRLGITESFEQEDGTVIIHLFKERWSMSDDGEMIQGKGAPIDVPLNSWIDVRLDMPTNDIEL